MPGSALNMKRCPGWSARDSRLGNCPGYQEVWSAAPKVRTKKHPETTLERTTLIRTAPCDFSYLPFTPLLNHLAGIPHFVTEPLNSCHASQSPGKTAPFVLSGNQHKGELRTQASPAQRLPEAAPALNQNCYCPGPVL